MGLFGWFKREPREDPRLMQWRQDWAATAAQPSSDRIRQLREQLQELGLDEDDAEIEWEMIEALERVAALASTVAEHGLPAVETGHRIAGGGVCHFTAPASMPDEPGQPAGRLLLTSARAAFAGGAASRTIAWHAIGEAAHQERDVLLIRADRDAAYRFRCNSYGDTLCATFIAQRCIAASGQARRPRV